MNFLYRLLVLSFVMLTTSHLFCQKAIGYIKMEGNDTTLKMRVISVADAISAGHGVVSVTMPDSTTGAAELVGTGDPRASELRLQTPYGTRSWKNETYFSNAFGGTSWDKAYGIVETDGGGFALCGTTYSYGAGSWDFMFLKLDTAGGFDWGKAMGNPSTNVGEALVQTHEKGYYLAGSAIIPSDNCYYAYVYHLDSSGTILFEGGYGTDNGDELGRDCIQTNDNNFVLVGDTDGFGAGGKDVYVKKTEYSNGNNIWGWAIGDAEDNRGHAIIQRSDGGYVVVGDTYTGSDWDIYYLLLDSGGNQETTFSIGGDGNDYGRDVAATYDGGYVVAGFSNTNGAGGFDFNLRKLDAAGNPLWTHYYGGISNDYCYAVMETSDHSIIMVGKTYSFGAGSYDIWLIKTDDTGNVLFSWVFGGSSWDEGWDIIEGNDGCLYVCGNVQSYGAGSEDALIIKYDRDGATCLGYEVVISGAAAPLQNIPDFKAQRVDNFIQTAGSNEVRKVDVESHPIKGDLIRFNPSSRDTVSITPTVTTICN